MNPARLFRSQSIRFQLTSLMDLLLIIVFAQYLEFHRSSAAVKAETQIEISETIQAVDAELRRQTEQLEETRSQLIRDNQQLRQRAEESALVAIESKRRQALTEELLKKLLQVDADLVDAELSPDEAIDTVENAQATAAAMSNADGTKLLRFLAGYDELLKRAEVWTIHVSDRGDIELQAGADRARSESFRLETNSQTQREEEFVRQLRAVYLQIPQPKGLVVILVSYSPRAVAGVYQPVLDGMPQLIEWLGKDSGDRSRFEYAVIGAITDPQRDLPVEGSVQ